ncbi:hypothetical protein [Nonomuraea sp. NPDC005692]
MVLTLFARVVEAAGDATAAAMWTGAVLATLVHERAHLQPAQG